MKPMRMLALIGSAVIVTGQTASRSVVTNLETAKWIAEKGSSPSSESAMLREDPQSGGMELFVRFPAGRVIAPHWHEANERIVVLEGALTLRGDAGETVLRPGGFAFLPAREVQKLSCSSTVPCAAYLAWDGKPKSFPAK